MSEPLLIKRLHISGLTPSITPEDLERRLSSFGKVKAMDGFGACDALGDPRNFGFVTMEVGAKELAKCLNVLSGSTWKGAKLRIGEAKPDFRERLAQINSQPLQPVRPKRTRVRNYGCPSSTLPLTPLSATAAASTPGWIVTSSGRVVRPMRMRPERPLEPMHTEPRAPKIKGTNGKVKKRVKPPPVRARRRLIDPTKWDSVYLRGVFLDTISVPLPISKDAVEPSGPAKYDIIDEEDEDEGEEDSTDSDALISNFRREAELLHHVPQLVQDRARFIPSVQDMQEAALATSPQTYEATNSIDVHDEANAALAMLHKMFGDKGDWNGRESVDGMEDLEDNEARGKEMHVDGDDIEIVPRDSEVDEERKVIKNDRGKGKGKEKSSRQIHFGHVDGTNLGTAHDTDVEMDGPPVSLEESAQTAKPAPRTSLRALFAPKEEASFSLLNHLDIDLDLDLDLDLDILGISAPSGASQDNDPPSKPTLQKSHLVQIPVTMSTTQARPRVTLDASLPLLFPPPDSLPHQHTPTTIHQYGTPTCFLFPSAKRVRGLHNLPPSITFTRSPQDTAESIRERWEKDKSSLTHEWKKAWREARGSRRGKVEARGDVGGGY